MIVSFASRETEELFNDQRPKRLPADILRVARRKLLMLNAANRLTDLKAPPGNRLEPLYGTRKGQHSIRINDQWRVCFRFESGHAYEGEITDYH